MRVCGNCGYWKIGPSKATGIYLGVCNNSQALNYLQATPATFRPAKTIRPTGIGLDCWSPEGGKGPKAKPSPPLEVA